MLPFWLGLLPLTHDLEEAKIQNEFLAVSLLKSPQFVIGANLERLEQIVKILGEICYKKQCEQFTLEKLSVVIANLSSDPAIGPQF